MGFLSVCLTFFVQLQSFLFWVKLLITTILVPWRSTLFDQVSTFSLCMLVLSSHFVSSLIISTSISWSFKPCISCSFSCLSISLWLHLTAAVVFLPIHSSVLSLDCLINLQNCKDFTVSLYRGLNFLLSVSNKPFSLWQASWPSCVRVAISCRLSLPSQFSVTDALYFAQVIVLQHITYL